MTDLGSIAKTSKYAKYAKNSFLSTTLRGTGEKDEKGPSCAGLILDCENIENNEIPEKFFFWSTTIEEHESLEYHEYFFSCLQR